MGVTFVTVVVPVDGHLDKAVVAPIPVCLLQKAGSLSGLHCGLGCRVRQVPWFQCWWLAAGQAHWLVKFQSMGTVAGILLAGDGGGGGGVIGEKAGGTLPHHLAHLLALFAVRNFDVLVW